MSKALDKELLKYWKLLNSPQKESIIEVIKSFLHPEGRISIEQYNKEIDEAMARMDAGKFITHEDLVKESEKW